MPAIKPYHISTTENDVGSDQPGGRFVFLPGSRERAREIADRFVDCKSFPSSRGHDVYCGRLRFPAGSVDVAAVSTGMGCPSVNIVVSELIGFGLKRFLRIGTAGSLQPEFVRVGDLVIAVGAVRDESTSLRYAPAEVPAVASPALVDCLWRAASNIGVSKYTHAGLVHSKDSLYAREFGHGALAPENERYMSVLRSLGVLASEMEASHLFILGLSQSCGDSASCEEGAGHFAAGCILGIIGGDEPFEEDTEGRRLAVQRSIDVGVEATRLFCLR